MTPAGRDDTLSEAQVRDTKSQLAQGLPRSHRFLAYDLAASHEALRARVAAVLRERDEASVEQLREHVRAEAAESRCRQLETAINDFFQRTGDHPRVCWDSFCGGGSHTALCSATSRLYASRAALVSAENGQT